MSDVKSFQTVFDETVIFFNTFMCEDSRLETTEERIIDELFIVLEPYRTLYDINGLHYQLLRKLIDTSEAVESITSFNVDVDDNSLNNGVRKFKGLGFKTDLKTLNQKLRDEQAKENEGGE